MNLPFLPKFLADVRNQAQVLLKRSCTLRKLVNTQIKGITLLCTGKNNICVSCVFNGFKYINNFRLIFFCLARPMVWIIHVFHMLTYTGSRENVLTQGRLAVCLNNSKFQKDQNKTARRVKLTTYKVPTHCVYRWTNLS